MDRFFSHMVASFRETFPSRASEWATASMLFLWAIVLAQNPDLFYRPGSVFRPLTDIASQGTWAWLCLVAGLGRLASLGINGAWRRTPHLRALTAFVTAGFWFLISVGIITSGNGTTGLAIYPVLFLLDAYNVIRSMGDAGSADRFYSEAHRNGPDT